MPLASLVDVGPLTRVLVTSLLAGGGLVAVFALGIVGVSTYVAPPADQQASGSVPWRRPAGLLLAVGCFSVVAAGVTYGLYVMLNK